MTESMFFAEQYIVSCYMDTSEVHYNQLEKTHPVSPVLLNICKHLETNPPNISAPLQSIDSKQPMQSLVVRYFSQLVTGHVCEKDVGYYMVLVLNFDFFSCPLTTL